MEKIFNQKSFKYFVCLSLPLVSTTPAIQVANLSPGIIDTGGKFETSVVDTGGAP
jgi:hypothetical protein